MKTARVDLADIAIHGSLGDLAETYSGARFERGEWQGTPVVLKHLPAEGDWLTRGMASTGRTRYLATSGILDHLSDVVDPAVIDVIEAPDGHDVVVMRDVTDALFPGSAMSRDHSRALVAGLAAMHEAGRSLSPVPLCSIASRYSLFDPAVHAADDGPGFHPARKVIVQGWEMFAEEAGDADVVELVLALHHAPERLGCPLERFEPTLLHGDTKLENLGLHRATRRLVLLDWGDFTGFGPPEVDLAWYSVMNTRRVREPDVRPDAVFADYEAARGRPLDPVALDLACVGALVQMGFRMPFLAEYGPEEDREMERRSLQWWVGRVREALSRLGGL